jgi:hypothetical protein
MLRQNIPPYIWASIALLLLTVLPTTSPLAYQFMGKVVSVLDGDTIEVLHN